MHVLGQHDRREPNSLASNEPGQEIVIFHSDPSPLSKPDMNSTCGVKIFVTLSRSGVANDDGSADRFWPPLAGCDYQKGCLLGGAVRSLLDSGLLLHFATQLRVERSDEAMPVVTGV